MVVIDWITTTLSGTSSCRWDVVVHADRRPHAPERTGQLTPTRGGADGLERRGAVQVLKNTYHKWSGVGRETGPAFVSSKSP